MRKKERGEFKVCTIYTKFSGFLFFWCLKLVVLSIKKVRVVST